MADFILVHGTFAKHASWTLNGSSLRKRIEALADRAGHHALFRPVPWGGRNLGRDRLAAAEAIAVEMRAINATDDENKKIFLIGHSHGGSAIAYFLKAFPELAANVTGVAFLSTPFVASRLRPQWTSFLRAILFATSVILLSGLYSVVGFFASMGVWDYRMTYEIVVFFPVASVLGFAAVIIGFVKISKYTTHYIGHTISVTLDSIATVNIPDGNYIFLRAIGDEAAGLLSGAHLFSWITNTVGSLVSVPIILLDRWWHWLTRRRYGKIVISITVGLFAVWIGVTFYGVILGTFVCAVSGGGSRCGYTQELWRHISILINMFSWLRELRFYNLNSYLIFLSLFLLSLSFCFLTLVMLMIFYSMVTFLAIGVSLLSLRLFGWMGLSPALFGDFAVEPTPQGSVILTHVDWKAEPGESILTLNHSRTYTNDDALEYLTNWIAKYL
jgi:hypothetical protein